VRCPYLFESEEFRLFIRPPIALEKALTLLPKLNFEENLSRINRYFSISGEISETQLLQQNNQVNAFVAQVRKMQQQMERFKDAISHFMQSFEAQWVFHK
jgi:hypothetical protein